MAIPAVAALIQLAAAGYKYAQGQKQKRMAEQLKPSNYVPNSVREAEMNARMDASATMGPMTKRGLEKLALSTETAISNAKKIGGTPGQLHQAVADADAREKEVVKDLEVSDAQWRYARRADLNRTLQTKGQYEKLSRDAFNSAKSALTGASMQNKNNAVTGAAEGIVYSLPDEAISPSGSGSSALNNDAVRNGRQLTRRGLYPMASMRLRPFDYERYLQELRTNRFSTGL